MRLKLTERLMAKRKLVIFPYNGNGIEALDCIDHEVYEVIGFIDDDQGKCSSNHKIFRRSIIEDYSELLVLAVPGSPSSFRNRNENINSLKLNPDRFITAIHPRASIGRNVSIGYNCLIMAGVVITSNAIIKNHVCILPNSVIHHDVKVNDYTLIGSNVVIAGGTSIGKNCYIGSGTNVINGVQIGDKALVGLGSNVIRSISENTTVAGNPALVLESKNNLHTLPPRAQLEGLEQIPKH
ncbi:NeuD/PglB/VioB family sugar acetyltransferase [Pedobacter sp. SAFR-022]|uniref:NeuD/PglB/VioB family sugar acetyltransferase n=1 Tax=Pedobacter sp. SAFR-022 TaxID=3436861 RepID=UPI003F7E385A